MTKIIKNSRINTTTLESLKQFIGSKENPKFFITMTQINKVGINPRSSFKTPLGVYCYPLIEEIYNQLISNTLPFVKDNPYINLITTSSSLFNLSNYSQADFDRDIKNIKDNYSLTDDNLDYYIRTAEAKENMIASKFWNITREMTTPSILKWSSLFRNLGYVGFYDPGMGLIHPSEPTQAVILDPSSIINVETFHNPNVVIRERNHPIYGDKFDNSSHLTKEEKNLLKKKEQDRNDSESRRISSIDFSPKKLMEIVDRSNNIENLVGVIKNKNTNSYIIGEILKKTEDQKVLEAILESPHASEKIIINILDKVGSINLYPFLTKAKITLPILKKLQDKNDTNFLFSVICTNQNVNQEVLSEIVNNSTRFDKDIASSPAAGDFILSKILERVDHFNVLGLKEVLDVLYLMKKNPSATQSFIEMIDAKVNQIYLNNIVEKKSGLLFTDYNALITSPVVSQDIIIEIIKKNISLKNDLALRHLSENESLGEDFYSRLIEIEGIPYYDLVQNNKLTSKNLIEILRHEINYKGYNLDLFIRSLLNNQQTNKEVLLAIFSNSSLIKSIKEAVSEEVQNYFFIEKTKDADSIFKDIKSHPAADEEIKNLVNYYSQNEDISKVSNLIKKINIFYKASNYLN